jgi:hypothetical protein
MAQPHLGTFTLKLGDIVLESREKDRQEIKELDRITKILEMILSVQKEGNSKNKINEILTMAEQKYTSRQNNIDDSNKKIGQNILADFEAQGIELPSSSALRGKKAKGEIGVVAKEEGKEEIASQSGVMPEKDTESKEVQKLVGQNLRKQVQLAFEADLDRKKEDLENIRKKDQASIK